MLRAESEASRETYFAQVSAAVRRRALGVRANKRNAPNVRMRTMASPASEPGQPGLRTARRLHCVTGGLQPRGRPAKPGPSVTSLATSRRLHAQSPSAKDGCASKAPGIEQSRPALNAISPHASPPSSSPSRSAPQRHGPKVHAKALLQSNNNT